MVNVRQLSSQWNTLSCSVSVPYGNIKHVQNAKCAKCQNAYRSEDNISAITSFPENIILQNMVPLWNIFIDYLPVV